MTTRNVIITLSLLFYLSQMTLAQKFQAVQAFKPGKELVEKLKAYKMQGIKIAGDGTTSPERGYKMVYARAEGQFYILPRDRKVAQVVQAATTKDLGGGMWYRCIGCTKCKVSETEKSNGDKVIGCTQNVCNDSYGCQGSVVVNKKKVTSFLDEGRWTDLD